VPTPRVRLNEAALKKQIALLQRIGIPSDHEDEVPIALSPSVMGMLNLVTVAINHQTTPVHGVALTGTIFGRERRGWDYLRESFLAAARHDASIVSPSRLAEFTIAQLNSILKGSPIKRPKERVELLHDIGTKMCEAGWEDIDALYRGAQRALLRKDGSGILQQLAAFRAYADPLRKKSNYFCAIMQNQGLWRFRDPGNLGPPVNYHESRLLARLGILRIADPELHEKLRRGWEVTEEEDFALRKAAYRAIVRVAKALNVSPSAMHYLDWNFARNCCTRSNPHCTGCDASCVLPTRYRIGEHENPRCVFSDICPSRDLPEGERLLDPFSETIWH